MTDGRGWHWVDADGVEQTLSTDELRSALADGSLSPDTKVRRAEIDGWVSAGDVPELFPRSLRPPPMAGAVPTPLPRPVAKPSISPPAVPRMALPTLVGHAPLPGAPSSARGSALPVSRPGAPRPATPAAAPVPPAPSPVRQASTPPPASSRTLPPPSMRPMPPSMRSATAPSRPPPPVRAQSEPVEVSAEIDMSVVQPPPPPPVPGKASHPPPPSSVRAPVEPVEVSAEIDTSDVAPPEVPKPAPLPAFATGSSPVLVDVEKTLEMRRAQPSTPPPPASAPRPASLPPSIPPRAPARSPVPAILGVVGLAAIGLVGALLVGRRSAAVAPPGAASSAPAAASSAPPPEPVASAPASASASAGSVTVPPSEGATAARVTSCKAGRAPVKLAPKVSRDVPIDVAVFGASPRVAIGYSSDGRLPIAISLDPSTFGARPEKVPTVVGKLRRVLPLPAAKGLKWAVNGDPKKLTRAEPVATDPPLSIGLAAGSLSFVEKPADAPKKLWSLPGGFDGARAIAVGEGVAVAVRSGNAIHVGMLEGRAPKGELARVSEDGQVGNPQIAASPDEIAIVFAWRAKAADKWSVRFAHGPRSGAPAKATALTIPGGPGGDATAPAIATLDGGGWLVVWTEGTVIRAVVIGVDGQPKGEAWTVSKADQDGDLSAVVAAPGGAVIAYATKVKGKPSELWGAGVTCAAP